MENKKNQNYSVSILRQKQKNSEQFDAIRKDLEDQIRQLIYRKNHKNEQQFVKSILADDFNSKRRSTEFKTIKQKNMMFANNTQSFRNKGINIGNKNIDSQLSMN